MEGVLREHVVVMALGAVVRWGPNVRLAIDGPTRIQHESILDEEKRGRAEPLHLALQAGARHSCAAHVRSDELAQAGGRQLAAEVLGAGPTGAWAVGEQVGLMLHQVLPRERGELHRPVKRRVSAGGRDAPRVGRVAPPVPCGIRRIHQVEVSGGGVAGVRAVGNGGRRTLAKVR
eukprot:767808-Prymnesium_polylepis.2